MGHSAQPSAGLLVSSAGWGPRSEREPAGGGWIRVTGLSDGMEPFHVLRQAFEVIDEVGLGAAHVTMTDPGARVFPECPALTGLWPLSFTIPEHLQYTFRMCAAVRIMLRQGNKTHFEQARHPFPSGLSRLLDHQVQDPLACSFSTLLLRQDSPVA